MTPSVCGRCGRGDVELNHSHAAGGVVCLRCHLRAAPAQVEPAERARAMYRGPERAARIGRIIAEDIKARAPLMRTLRDVLQANAMSFDPPFPEEQLQAIVRRRLDREGVTVDE